MRRLTAKLRVLLLMGVKNAGNYKPEDALVGIEEQMTQAECQAAMTFLQWCVDNKRTFGHNINEVWAEHVATR